MNCNCHTGEKLSESEQLLIENIRVLSKQDPTFEYTTESLNDILSILRKRGAKYNGDTSGVLEQIYGMKDMSAFVHTQRPVNRMKQILSNNGIYCPDDEILDKIIDTNGYSIMWLNCRKWVRSNGYQLIDNQPYEKRVVNG